MKRLKDEIGKGKDKDKKEVSFLKDFPENGSLYLKVIPGSSKIVDSGQVYTTERDLKSLEDKFFKVTSLCFEFDKVYVCKESISIKTKLVYAKVSSERRDGVGDWLISALESEEEKYIFD